MSDYSEISDLELCERISEARGWQKVFLKLRNDTPFVWQDETHTIRPNQPDWLSWEYAGRLLEELIESGNEIEMRSYDGVWHLMFCDRGLIDPTPVRGTSVIRTAELTRAICEAWLSRKTEDKTCTQKQS